MRGRPNQRFVIDYAARVEDHRIADLTMGADQGPGGDDDVPSEGHVAGQVGRRMNRVDQFQADLFQPIGESPAHAVVPHGHDAALQVETAPDSRQVVRVAQDGKPVYASAVDLSVRVDEADDLIPTGVEEHVEDDPSVATASQDDTLGFPLGRCRF